MLAWQKSQNCFFLIADTLKYSEARLASHEERGVLFMYAAATKGAA
jgi:hypothetical protein